EVERAACDSGTYPYEFYDLQPTLLNPVGLDLETNNLIPNGDTSSLTPEQLQNYQQLQSALQAFLNSEPVCYGDGNLDKQVNGRDIAGWTRFRGQPSWFDFNNDGTTDAADLDCIRQNLGNNCLRNGPGSGCN